MKLFGRNQASGRKTVLQNVEAQNLLEEMERQLERASKERMARVSGAMTQLAKGWEQELESDMVFVTMTGSAREALRDVRRPRPIARTGRMRFQVSSRFLRDCWQYLTSDPQGHERLHLVTGTVTDDGLKVLSQIEKVDYQEKSAGYVASKPADTHRRLIELERDGHEMLAMFHSHIMHGRESTRPSQIDLDNQERFLKIGWDAIGGIFSLDGYVRLFGTGKEFDVVVYGQGAEILQRAARETIIKLDVAGNGGARSGKQGTV